MSDEDIKKISKYNEERRYKKRRISRKIQKTQRRIDGFRAILRLFTIIAILYLCYHIVYMKSWRLPTNTFSSLNNPALKISNNKIVPSYKILTAIRQIEIPNKAIFLIKTDEIRNSILKLEPIQDVYVRRFWFPARLEIIIKERIPTIVIAPNENVQPIAYFTKDGKLIGHEYMPLKANYKTVKVLAYCTKDNDYRKWDLAKLNLIRKFSKAIETYSNEKVQYIDLRNPEDVYVKIDSVLLRIGPFEAPIYDETIIKISRLPSLIPQVKLLGKNIKYLDLRWDKVYYVKLADDKKDNTENNEKKN